MKKCVLILIGVVILACVAVTAGYYTVSGRTETALHNLVEKQSFIQMASYRKGLTSSAFQLEHPVKGLQLLGTIEHGPWLVRSMEPGVSKITLQLSAEGEGNPLADVLEKIPELADAKVVLKIGFGGAMTLDGAIPVIDRPLEIDGDKVSLKYTGATLTGTGKGDQETLENLDLKGDLGLLEMESDEIRITFGPITLDETVKGLVDSIPTDLKARVDMGIFSIQGQDNGQPVSLVANSIQFVEEIGIDSEKTLHGIGELSIKKLIVNEEQVDDLFYKIQIAGLQEEGVRKLQKMINGFQAQSVSPDQMAAEFQQQLQPVLKETLAGAPSLTMVIAGESPTYGKSLFQINAALSEGGDEYLPRLKGDLKLNVGEPLAKFLASLYMMKQFQGAPADQLPTPDQILEGFVQQQMITFAPDTNQYQLGVNLDGAADSLRLDAGMELPPPSMLAQLVLAGMQQGALGQ